MPRTTTLDCPGCPPLRALTFDELGLIKVIEARGKQGRAEPKVVERWGDPDSSKCVLAASIDDRKSDPLLAVARRNGMVEVLNPLNGDLRFAFSNASINGVQSEDDPVAGLHLFAKKKSELASRSCTLLTCTTKGNASMRSFEVNKPAAEVASWFFKNMECRWWWQHRLFSAMNQEGNERSSKLLGRRFILLLGKVPLTPCPARELIELDSLI